MIGTRTTVIAPVGPLTWTRLPPKMAATAPATIAVMRPAEAPMPELAPNPSARGRATSPTMSPAVRSRPGAACAQSDLRGSSCVTRAKDALRACVMSGSCLGGGRQLGLELTARRDDPRQDVPGGQEQVAHAATLTEYTTSPPWRCETTIDVRRRTASCWERLLGSMAIFSSSSCTAWSRSESSSRMRIRAGCPRVLKNSAFAWYRGMLT